MLWFYRVVIILPTPHLLLKFDILSFVEVITLLKKMNKCAGLYHVCIINIRYRGR